MTEPTADEPNWYTYPFADTPEKAAWRAVAEQVTSDLAETNISRTFVFMVFDKAFKRRADIYAVVLDRIQLPAVAEPCQCGEPESTHGWGDPPHLFTPNPREVPND